MRASAQTEERVGELKAEVERLRWEVVRHREMVNEARTGRKKAGKEASSWRRKILALAEHYRKRIRHLSQWSERLSRDRAALKRERKRLTREVESLITERDALSEGLSRFRREALSWFLGGALEEDPTGERIEPVKVTGESEQKILSLLQGRRGNGSQRGRGKRKARTGA